MRINESLFHDIQPGLAQSSQYPVWLISRQETSDGSVRSNNAAV
jgi:hypothetical protein